MRRHTLLVLALGGLAACGDTQDDRETTGALSGAAMGAIVGGPIGAIIGAGAGYLTGNKLDKSADEKIEELAHTPMGSKPEAAPAPKAAAAEPKAVPEPRAAKTPEPASGSTDGGKVLTQAQIEEKLNTAGYKPVHGIRRDGPAYVARGERNGTLYEVRVEAATGQLLASREVGIVRRPAGNGDTPATVMTEQQLRTTLRQSGYEMVGDVTRAGDRYRAEAMQNGRMYDLVVDGRTGRVVELDARHGHRGDGPRTGRIGAAPLRSCRNAPIPIKGGVNTTSRSTPMFPPQLESGYRAFLGDRFVRERQRFRDVADRQRPEVMVIGCCDSRVSPEVIFDTSPGEIFVVRNVANLVPPYRNRRRVPRHVGRTGVRRAGAEGEAHRRARPRQLRRHPRLVDDRAPCHPATSSASGCL